MRRESRLVIELLLPLLALAFGGCRTEEPKDSQKLREVSLRQEWFANANFAGAVLASQEFAADHGVKIKIEEGAEDVDPVSLVAAGHNDFGDAAADRVIAAVAKGAPLVVIGVVSPSSPTVFLAKAEKNIHTPKDFEGHTVGVLSGTATEYVYRTLLQQTGVSSSSVKEVEAGFDLQGFLTDQYEVRPAFAYDEPVSLRQQGLKFVTIDPREYGVHFIGTVYFTSRKMIAEHPNIVQAFVSSVADGWSLALADPERAIEALHQMYPTIDKQRELASLQLAKDYVLPPNGRLLLASDEDWSGTLQALRKLNVVGDLPVSKFVDSSFVLKYLDTEGSK